MSYPTSSKKTARKMSRYTKLDIKCQIICTCTQVSMYILAVSSRTYFVMVGFQASASSQRGEEGGTKRTASSCEYENYQSILSLRKELCVLFAHRYLPLMVYMWMHKFGNYILTNQPKKKFLLRMKSFEESIQKQVCNSFVNFNTCAIRK